MRKNRIDSLDVMSFMNGLVFFSPVALLVRTAAGVSVSMFFLLQVLLSVSILFLEIPTGKLSDKIGYKNTLVLSQVMLCLSRILLFLAYSSHSMIIFVIEVFAEGLAACFTSGTQSAYIYSVVDEERFVAKTAHVSNCGTAGFVISTLAYAGIYRFSGISGLLIATIVSSAIGTVAAFMLKKETMHETSKEAKAKIYLKDIFNLNTLWLVILITAVNLAFILINFFYVDKLISVDLSEEYMTVIILGYSLIQLLSEFILKKVSKDKYNFVMMISFAVLGICLIVFGLSSNVAIVILLMLVMPLEADIAAYILDGVQNSIIDEINQEEKRAEMMSIYNMGVSFMEIIFLLFSAAVSDIGAVVCYCALGGLMILLSLGSLMKSKMKKGKYIG